MFGAVGTSRIRDCNHPEARKKSRMHPLGQSGTPSCTTFIAKLTATASKPTHNMPKIVHSKRRMPSALVIRTSGKLKFEFASVKSALCLETLQRLVGASTLETAPGVDKIEDLEWSVYADGEGMMKQLPMNCLANPFVAEHYLISAAKLGGPYGTMVLHAEEGTLDRALLTTLCSEADEREETDGEYVELLMQAFAAWDDRGGQEEAAAADSGAPSKRSKTVESK